MDKYPKLVLGFVGKFGAGKGQAISYLVEKHGFYASSTSDRIREEIRREGKEITRETLAETAGRLRQEVGLTVLAERTWEDILKKGSDLAVVDAIRSIPEVEFFKSLPNFHLISVDADPKTRFQRMVERSQKEGRSDPLTWEDFVKTEEADLVTGGRNVEACMELADYHLRNDGTLEELHNQLDQLLGKLINLPT